MNINNGGVFSGGDWNLEVHDGFMGNYPKTKIALKVVGYIALEILKAAVKK